jgi:hypothetical protein
MSLLYRLYLALVSFTSLNYVLVISKSFYSILYLFLARLKTALNLSKRLTKRLA